MQYWVQCTVKFLLPALTFCLSIALLTWQWHLLQILWSGFKSIRITPSPLSSFTLQVSNFQKILFLPLYISKNLNRNFTWEIAVKGNLLKGIANKTVRTQGFRKLHPLFTYVLFSVTHFFNIKNCSKLQVFM